MDFPPMDWGALFAFNPAVLDPHLADPTGTSATSDANGPEGLRGAQLPHGTQQSDVDNISKLGVCSSCRKYGPVCAYKP
jgi:hypothetical protein